MAKELDKIIFALLRPPSLVFIFCAQKLHLLVYGRLLRK